MKKSIFIISLCLVIFNILYSEASKPSAQDNYPAGIASACEKCDLKKLKLVHDNLEKLNEQTVSDFLCTFDPSCADNAEYSEWSNELLFSVMNKAPELFLKLLEQGQAEKKLLLEKVRNPVNDDDLQKVYDQIKNATGNGELKKMFLDAISVAQEKNGRKIVK